MVTLRPLPVCLALAFGLLLAGHAHAAGKHVYLLRGIFNVSTGLDELAARLNKAGVAASVYGHGDSDLVAAEATRAWKAGRVRAIVLIGHSLGAAAAVAVAEQLNAAKIPVALLVTLDQGSVDAIPPNVRRAVNFYVAGSGGLVVGDKGFRGSLQNINVGDIPGMDHMRVQDMKVMQDRMLALARGA